MNITYDQILEVNKGIKYTDVRGKNYAEVAQRVQAFRKLIPGGYITTEILKMEGGLVYMKAEAGYYEDGKRVMLATGYAYERQDASHINQTSYIENCETSAVGRCLGFIGLGTEHGIASAEEINSQNNTRDAIERGDIPPVTPFAAPQAGDGTVSTASAVPQISPEQAQVDIFLRKAIKQLREDRGIGYQENNKLFADQFKALVEAGLAPNKRREEYTLEEAEALIDAMYKNFPPTSAVMNP